MDPIILSVLAGIALLLLLILVVRIHAFIALLLASIVTGLLAGMEITQLMDSIKNGMGGTLGFVATIVGLGAILGGILEKAGGVQVISKKILAFFGEEKAPLALLISGFIISIPVFFDVAFIILVPVIYALQKNTGKSLLAYAIPLLAGLAITHAFIPPTPGPVAVADILKVDLGPVILIGFLVGLPTAIISGLLFGKFISKKIHISATDFNIEDSAKHENSLPSFHLVMSIILIPILLILLSTSVKGGLINLPNDGSLSKLIQFLGHPFSALIIANLLAWYLLGIRKGYSREGLFKISSASLSPAGTIILLTGAGGVFKQILVETKAGEIMAQYFNDAGIPVLVFAFLTASIIRLVQGSATVAMITAAGLVAPLLVNGDYSAYQLAAMVITIASGASIFSHVNDSGFWLVSQYLGMNEKQTFRSWSMMTLILALSGFAIVSLVYFFL